MALDNFNLEIETRALAKGSYIDALTEFCEEKEMDEYDVVELLHANIIAKVKDEFKQRNYFPGQKSATLDDFFSDETIDEEPEELNE